MTQALRLVGLCFLALSTIYSIPLRSDAAPALGLVLPSTLAVEPAPSCYAPQALRPRVVAPVVLEDCYLIIFGYLVDPIVSLISEHTKGLLKNQGDCTTGFYPSTIVPTDLIDKFSLLDLAIAAARIIRLCIIGSRVNVGGSLDVGPKRKFKQIVFNPVETASRTLLDLVPSPQKTATSSALATLPPPSSNLALPSSSNSSTSLAETLDAGITCFEVHTTPAIVGTDCLYLFFYLLAQDRVKSPQSRSGTGSLPVYRRDQCMLTLSATRPTSLDYIRLSDIIIAAARMLYECVLFAPVRREGGRTLINSGEFSLTLTGGPPLDLTLANTNRTAVGPVEDVAFS